MPLSSKEKILVSLRALGRVHPEIEALYLFGSEASRRAGPLSDLDFAVLADDAQLSPKRRFDFRLNLLRETMAICRRPDVELILLNEANPLLAYEVVSGGRLLYERRRRVRVAFEAGAMCEYLDLKPFYRVSRLYLKRQLLKEPRRGQS